LKTFLYLENAPIAEECVGFGLERVNGRLADALGRRVSGIIVNEASPWSPTTRLRPSLRGICWRLLMPAVLSRFARLFAPMGLGSQGERLALWLPLLKAWKRLRGTNMLLVPIGSDDMALMRGRWLAQKLGIPYVIYAVDDCELMGGAYPGFRSDLLDAHRIFALTPTLCAVWQQRYGVSCRLLNLPYEVPEQEISPQRSSQILFLGSLNALYAERLVCLHKVVREINREDGFNLTLRFTIAKPEQVLQLLGSLESVVIQPCEGESAFHDLLASSLMCYAPYSFDPAMEHSVRTSFPSKVLEYLAWAPCILADGPEYSSLCQMFSKSGLPELIINGDPESLLKVVRRIAKDQPNHSKLYRAALRQEHSYERCQNQWDSAWV